MLDSSIGNLIVPTTQAVAYTRCFNATPLCDAHRVIRQKLSLAAAILLT